MSRAEDDYAWQVDPAAVARQLLAEAPTTPDRRSSDEIANEDRLESIAEDRAYERRHGTDDHIIRGTE